MLSVDMIVPAAGIGKRMASSLPKQYLKINNKTVIEHTISTLLNSPYCNRVIVATRADDCYFSEIPIAKDNRVVTVDGGAERVDSVLNALKVASTEWVLVHDAARPCLSMQDLEKLIMISSEKNGGILACPVRDTMKRTDSDGIIQETVERKYLYHALTPQFFKREQLVFAIEKGLSDGVVITDESSAMEYAGFRPLVVEGRSDNIKITQPADLNMAEFILNNMRKV